MNTLMLVVSLVTVANVILTTHELSQKQSLVLHIRPRVWLPFLVIPFGLIAVRYALDLLGVNTETITGTANLLLELFLNLTCSASASRPLLCALEIG